MAIGILTGSGTYSLPDFTLDDGTQGIDDNYIRNAMLRLTYQLSPRHKLGAYY